MARRFHFSIFTARVASAVAAAAAIAIVVQLALLERTPPVRCPGGMVLSGSRCCGHGQSFGANHCEGRANACGPRQRFQESEGEPSGCVFENERVQFEGGTLPAGAADWQVSSGSNSLEVKPFALDSAEVTFARYAVCLRSAVCTKPIPELEPGLPLTGLSPAEAERFCEFEGGRLPTSAEWRFAASGKEGRRFPWGFTGLVCRRASFGLLDGPCGSDASGPDLAGARPDGATPEGIVDLAGNVAEWTRDPDGRYRARGGSYRSRVAVELVTAALEPSPNPGHVGFRCAYAAD
ncbi:MAG: SUMF1/EgtB/PvdO family nonheme iron enzyme [Polyangiaceae bacterium]